MTTNNDSTRVKGTSIVKAIIYGNTAKYFGQKRSEDGHTHKWSVYVKPYLDEDIGTWVKKVHFKLHDSYETPTRVVQKPPFEISETGWGEFELVIKIFFQDTSERPVTLYHVLKLYSNGSDSELNEQPVLSEFYEEIIFQDPSTYMKYVLNDSLSNNPQIAKENLHYEEIKKNTVNQLVKARKKVQDLTVLYKERLKKLRETIDKYKDEICALQSQCSSSTLR
ncbi:YEATS [Cinara cedri]|uniref:YEATS n=1 Tax=Cinara cedri TaxID=506608 RepID=A0A5E4MGG5_9HEMI|nr:YEATS [Cinara cedri]